MGRVSDRYGRGILITISLFFYIISMFLLARADDSVTLLMAGFAEGTGAGILIPTVLALISDRSYSNERGRVYALCLGGFDVGIALAGPILGFMESYLSYQGVFYIATVLAAIAFVIFITCGNQNLTRSLGFACGQEKDVFALD